MEMVYNFPAIIVAMTFHEFAHAYVAYLMGDETAKQEGRLTLNPVKHVDIIGMVTLLFAGFGWAKPVPVNESRFRNRKLGVFLVSIAGVVMNIFIAILSAMLLFKTSESVQSSVYDELLLGMISVNIAFAAFNLLPIPPLDGSKLVASVLPSEARYTLYRYERYGMILMLLLIYTEVIDVLLNPVVKMVYDLVLMIAGLVV